MRTTRSALALSAVTLVGVGLLAPAAQASGSDDRVEARGACSGNSVWKLKAKPDDNRNEVEFEVDSNVNGQSWSVRITDNGTQVFSGTRTTKAPSGSFTVAIRPVDRAGTDTFRAVATNAATGERCVGSVTL